MALHNPFQKDTNVSNKSKLPILLNSTVWGAITAVISLPFEHPFDVIKTNMQANQQPIKMTVKSILSRKGIYGFYNGFSMNLLRAALKQAYRWPLWISIGSFYNRILSKNNEIVKQTITGFSISLCELIIICPFERIKVWLMTTKNEEETRIKKYYERNFRFRDLYTGFIALLFKQGFSWSSFLASSEILKREVRKLNNSETLTSKDLFMISIPVSIINTILIMPMDCIKTSYQQYTPNSELSHTKSFSKMALELLSKYGWKGLYLGWSARLIQYTIQSALTLVVIEEFHLMFAKTNI